MMGISSPFGASLRRVLPCLMIVLLQLGNCEQLYVDTARQSPRRSLALFEKETCPETEIQQDFQTQEFLGRWYEMYRPYKQPYQLGDCNFANYSLKPDGILRVINSQRFSNFPGKLGRDDSLAPETARGFSQGVVPISNKPGQKPKVTPAKIQMGLVPNAFKNKETNEDYMYNERFGNIEWKYKDAQNRIYQYRQAEGMARKLDADAEDGRFQLKFSKFQPVWGNYHVLDTDYTSYTIVYSCRTKFGGRFKNEYVWILTRNPLDPNDNASEFNRITQKAKDVLGKNVPTFDFDKLMRRTTQGVQNDCIYPEDQFMQK